MERHSAQYHNGESHYRFVKPLSIVIHGMDPKLLAVIGNGVPTQAHPRAIKHTKLGEMVGG